MKKPNETTAAISRRTIISTLGMAAPIAALALTVGPAAAQQRKMAQRAVAYQATPHNDQRCDNCALFQAPDACRSVAGDIAPAGWCRIWVRARQPAGAPAPAQ